MKEKQEHFFAKNDEEIKQAAPEGKPVEPEGLHERLSLIVRTISGKLNLEVTTDVDLPTLLRYAKEGKDARTMWFRQVVRDPKTKKFVKERVHIPEQISGSNENVPKGIAAHEAGHVIITRQAEFVPDEVLKQLGFHAVLQAVEERPTDQVVRERYSGAGLWVDESRKEGNQKYRAMSDEEKKALGYIPKFMQFADLCVYAPHYEELPPYNPDVLAAYESVREYVEMAEKTLPAEGAEEKEVVNKAKERYSIMYAKIWPEAEKLVKKDRELEELRQMLEQAMSGSKGENGEKKEGQESTQNNPEKEKIHPDPAKLQELLNSLPEELKNELKKLQASGNQGQASEKKESDAGEQNKQYGTDENETEEGETGSEENGLDEPAKGQGNEEKQGRKPFPVDRISDALKKELRKIFENLSEKEKEFLQHIAQKTLEHIEDEIVKEFSAKFAEEEPETHATLEARQKRKEQIKKQKETEERLKLEKEQVGRELEEIERKQAKISENKGEYMRAYEEVRGLDEALYPMLDEIFSPNIKRNIKLKSVGLKPNLFKVFKWEAGIKAGAKAIDNKIFESFSRHEKKDYAFSILNDMSDSMREEGKIEHDFKAKILLSEVLNRLGVKFSVAGFNDGFFMFKNFGEELTDGIRKKMDGIKSIGGYTDTGRALAAASGDLEKEFAKEKFLLVLTDGIPYLPLRDAPADTHRAVSDILKKNGQKLIGIGLGPGTEFVREFFPASIVENDVKKLPETLAALLEDMILNPEKYAYNKSY